MLRWLVGGALVGSLFVVSAAAFVACGDSTQETLCVPDTEVFCKCRGGSDGTKTCLADGNTFGECTTLDGPCPEITETTETSGTTQLCIPDTESPCSCDNGDDGTKVCASDGLSFGDCMTVAGACGTSTTGDKLLYAKCASGNECETGVCDGGYCTKACEDFSVCVDDEHSLLGDCIVLDGGTKQQCAQYCTQQSDCAGYGPESACGGARALDDATLSFAACANWGEDLQGMPVGTVELAGTTCFSDTGELVFIDTLIVMDCNIGLSGAQDICLFGECTKGCDVDDDCPEMDCSATLPCCTSDPEC